MFLHLNPIYNYILLSYFWQLFSQFNCKGEWLSGPLDIEASYGTVVVACWGCVGFPQECEGHGRSCGSIG